MLVKCCSVILTGVILAVFGVLPSFAAEVEGREPETLGLGGDRAAHLELMPRHKMDTESCYRFRFNDEPVADLDKSELTGYPLRNILVCAAQLYALATEDYEVTLDEVLAAGYWPYEILPEVEPEDCVLSRYDSNRLFSERTLTDVGSPEWLLRERDSILSMFIGDYYFYPDFVARDAVLEYDPVLPDDLVPIEEFWVNPLTGRPFEFGEVTGQLSEWPLDWSNLTEDCRITDGLEELIVVRINKWDLMPVEYREDGRIVAKVSEYMTITRDGSTVTTTCVKPPPTE